jgi:thiol:disulfide interchange protein DsbA
MNCATIDSMIDDHRVARLSAEERQQAAEHVGGCARCSAAWAADDALRGERIADPAPELFATLARRAAVAAAPREAAAARGRWWWVAAAAAVIAVVAIAFRFGVIEPDARSLNSVSARAVNAISSPSSPILAASPFVAGRDYELLPGATARAAVAGNGKIEVIEFFMFWCHPCYAFEPELDRWEARASSDVSLTRVPALFNAAAQLQARAFYTAEVLGKLDAMQDAFFAEIHERGNALASRAALADFFERFDVDAATFDATFDSSEVDARMQRAVALNREYGITSTPTLVVAGRYSTAGLAGRGAPADKVWSEVLAVVDHLVKESKVCRDRCVERAR